MHFIIKPNLFNRKQRVHHSLTRTVLKRHPLKSHYLTRTVLKRHPLKSHSLTRIVFQAPPTHVFKRFVFRTPLVTYPFSYQFKLATLSFETLFAQQPPHIPSWIRSHSTFSSHHFLSIPICWTEFDKCAFSFSAPSVWNFIPFEIRSSSSLPSFNRRLKWLFFIHPS